MNPLDPRAARSAIEPLGRGPGSNREHEGPSGRAVRNCWPSWLALETGHQRGASGRTALCALAPDHLARAWVRCGPRSWLSSCSPFSAPLSAPPVKDSSIPLPPCAHCTYYCSTSRATNCDRRSARWIGRVLRVVLPRGTRTPRARGPAGEPLVCALINSRPRVKAHVANAPISRSLTHGHASCRGGPRGRFVSREWIRCRR